LTTARLDAARRSAVKNVPDDASVSDAMNNVSQSAHQLASAAQSTALSVNCS
jgi:hypothetical protein